MTYGLTYRHPLTPSHREVEKQKRIVIGANAQEVVQLVRRYSESQVDTWRKVPWLALQADGYAAQHYHNLWYDIAYNGGLWTLPVTNSFKNGGVYVDCDTGKLVDRELKPLGDVYILAAASPSYIGDLDAERVVSCLIEVAEQGGAPWISKEAQQAWRTELAAEHGLTEVYKRKSPPKWDDRLV